MHYLKSMETLMEKALCVFLATVLVVSFVPIAPARADEDADAAAVSPQAGTQAETTLPTSDGDSSSSPTAVVDEDSPSEDGREASSDTDLQAAPADGSEQPSAAAAGDGQGAVSSSPSNDDGDHAVKKRTAEASASDGDSDGFRSAMGVVPDRTPALSVHDENENGMGAQAVADLPSSYSSKDSGFVTPVKNQEVFSTCWAFSLLAAAESSAIAKGLDASPDFSERHLAYFTYHDVSDPLGNTAGDSSKPLKGDEFHFSDEASENSSAGGPMDDPYLMLGGNTRMSMLTLASWRGIANEDAVPTYKDMYEQAVDYVYVEYKDDYAGFFEHTALDSSLAYGSDSFHLKGCNAISMKDADDVKRAVMEYGGASVQIRYLSKYYNHDSDTLYNYEEEETNHEVEIVGWDDDFDASKFGVTRVEDDYGKEPPNVTDSLRIGEKMDVPHGDGVKWLTFVPGEDGVYRLASESDAVRVDMSLYRLGDDGLMYHCNSRDDAESFDWDNDEYKSSWDYTLEKGAVYYLRCKSYAEKAGAFELSAALVEDAKDDRPSGNGAWLAKNSWGKGSNDDGYFWISYKDACLQSSTAKAYVADLAPVSDFGHIYQYDGTASSKSKNVASGGSIANVYTASGNAGGAEAVSGVSFVLDDVNVDYSVQVYANVRDTADPTSGSPALESPVTGKTSYSGYYTVNLPEPVPVAEGSMFSVVVTLSHADGTPVEYAVDSTYNDDGYVQYTNAVATGQSFERSSAGASWVDLAAGAGDDLADCSARLKAFTDDIDASEVPDFYGIGGIWGTCTWTVESGVLTIRPTDGVSGQLAEPNPSEVRDTPAFPWSGGWWGQEVFGGSGSEYYVSGSKYRSDVRSIRIEPGVKAGKSIRRMFSGFSLESLDIANLDTSGTEDMSWLFSRTSVEQEADLGFDTRNVVNMSGMFSNSSWKAGWRNDDGWNVDKVKDISYMFSGIGIDQLTLNHAFASAVDAHCMFNFDDCDVFAINKLDLSKLDNRNADCENFFFLEVSELVVGDTFAFPAYEGENSDYAQYYYSRFPSLSGATYYDEGAGKWASKGWWSEREQRYFTPEEVFTTRSFIADTYTAEPRAGSSGRQAVDISSASVAAADQVYTGQALTPAPTVTLGGKTLAAGTDYDVAYSGNVDVGTAAVTVTGKGNYAGTATGTFRITAPAAAPGQGAASGGSTSPGDAVSATPAKASIAGAKVTNVWNMAYTGKAQMQKPTVTLGGKALRQGTDYKLTYRNNVKVGTATMTITGIGGYTGTKTSTFKVTVAANSLAKAKVTGAKKRTYNGTAQTQSPKVKLGKKALKAGRDYMVTYSRNVNAGTATATVRGIGAYSGSKSFTFKIAPAKLSKAKAGVAAQRYTGRAVTPDPVVKAGGKVLRKGVDYTVTYKNNVKKGTASLTIKGKGNYTGKKTVKFKIS